MEREFRSKPFYFRVKGENALFTDPATKASGEKFTYQVGTLQAIKGIAEAIYWKPSLVYYIDSIKIINQIKTETIGVRALYDDGKSDLNYHTYLKDVEYLVKYHFEWNTSRDDLKADRQEIKHQEILLRSLDRGGRRDIFLGTRECIAYAERLAESFEESEFEFENAKSFYDAKDLSFGIMFHSFTYPGENIEDKNSKKLIANYSNILMKKGRIDFCRPEECIIRNEVKNYNAKLFTMDSIKNVEIEHGEVMRGVIF